MVQGALLLLAACVLLLVGSAHGAVMKHSFKAPFYLGNALVTEEYVRLTSDQKSQKGSIWNTLPVSLVSWEVTMEFGIAGGRQGADGMAFWYVQDPEKEGPVYGSEDKWQGLGVFIDTFDNNGRGAGPSVLAVLNDGNKAFDHASDGESLAAGRCTAALRNQAKHSFLRISYEPGTLKVDIDAGGNGWRPCFTAPMTLPQGYYFGVSAATGGLADAHDLFQFSTLDLHRGPPPSAVPNAPPTAVPQQQQQQVPQTQPTVAVPQVPQVPSPAPIVDEHIERPSYVTAAPTPPAYVPPNPPPYVPVPSPPVQQQQDAMQMNLLVNAVSGLQQQMSEMRREMQELRQQLSNVPSQTAAEATRMVDSAAERHANGAAERFGGLLNTQVTSIKTSIQELQSKSRGCDELKPSLEEVKNTLRSVKAQADTSVAEGRNVVTEIRGHTERLTNAIASSGSVGFWTYAIFLQFLFFGAFLLWQRNKREQKYRL